MPGYTVGLQSGPFHEVGGGVLFVRIGVHSWLNFFGIQTADVFGFSMVGLVAVGYLHP